MFLSPQDKADVSRCGFYYFFRSVVIKTPEKNQLI